MQEFSVAEVSEIARNFSLILLGFIGLPLAIWRSMVAHRQAKTALRQANHTAKQIALVQQGQLADRFAKAAEMISSDQKGELREAGILQLKSLVITDQDGEYYFPSLDLLCTFIRSRSRSLSDGSSVSSSLSMALIAFSELRNSIGGDREEACRWRPKLDDANFSCFRDRRVPANFKNADLFNANLAQSYFEGATFEHAIMDDCDLRGAEFVRTNFNGTIIHRAELEGMTLDQDTLNTLSIDDTTWRIVKMDGYLKICAV